MVALRQVEAAAIGQGRHQRMLLDQAQRHIGESLDALADLVASWQSHPEAVEAPAVPPRPRRRVLEAEIEEWVASLAAVGVKVELSVDGARDLASDSAKEVLAEILAEAAANVARHSAAGAAAIDIVFGPDRTVLRVTDPGPSKGGTSGSRSGLRRLRRRVAGVGGHLAAGPGRAGGFGVEATVPTRCPVTS